MNQEKLKSLVDYVDNTLKWKHTKGRKNAGQEIGTRHCKGYRQAQIEGKRYLVHRLVFLYHHGRMPDTMIDHIDGNRLNNSINNLRECDRAENGYNSRKRKDNTSGYKNVSWSKATKKWTVRMSKDKKYQVVGYFDTIESAILAAKEARDELHGAFAKHN